MPNVKLRWRQDLTYDNSKNYDVIKTTIVQGIIYGIAINFVFNQNGSDYRLVVNCCQMKSILFLRSDIIDSCSSQQLKLIVCSLRTKFNYFKHKFEFINNQQDFSESFHRPLQQQYEEVFYEMNPECENSHSHRRWWETKYFPGL